MANLKEIKAGELKVGDECYLYENIDCDSAMYSVMGSGNPIHLSDKGGNIFHACLDTIVYVEAEGEQVDCAKRCGTCEHENCSSLHSPCLECAAYFPYPNWTPKAEPDEGPMTLCTQCGDATPVLLGPPTITCPRCQAIDKKPPDDPDVALGELRKQEWFEFVKPTMASYGSCCVIEMGANAAMAVSIFGDSPICVTHFDFINYKVRRIPNPIAKGQEAIEQRDKLVAALYNWCECHDHHDMNCRCGFDRAYTLLKNDQSPNPIVAGQEHKHLLCRLLAIIHGDGGHYAAEHGLEKATDDATKKEGKLKIDSDRLALVINQRDKLVAALRDDKLKMACWGEWTSTTQTMLGALESYVDRILSAAGMEGVE